MNTPIALLGGLTAEQFLSEYWQKKPLLVRGALTDVGPHVDFDVLAELSLNDEVESRLIENRAGKWRVEHGPFRPSRFTRLPETDWTILVQGVNQHLPHVADILWSFDFLPFARLDDLMISYAPPGGTVGPHFDSYDVFLLQVGGRKSWKISGQDDIELVDGAPIKILKHFREDEEFVVEHGDLLYLPPKYAHYGVAQEPGMTYSIGFRAPSVQELATQFLIHLQDTVCLDGMYADPDLQPQAEPALIGEAMIDQVTDMLKRIEWNRDTVADFLGRYLTEPKAQVFYESPDDELDEDEFAEMARARGLVLDLKSQILFTATNCYVNGELLEIPAADLPAWRAFANARKLDGDTIGDAMLDQLYEGYCGGYWHFG